jgi:hypothetical protein
MSGQIFKIMKLLEERGVHFFIERNRADNITFFATTIGKRFEIYVDENDNVDFSVFRGNEDVIVGMDALIAELDAE